MKVCPHCGSHNVPTNLRCFLCGSPLDSLEQPDGKLQRLKPKRRGLIYRFIGLAEKVQTSLSPLLRTSISAKARREVPHRDVWLAATLSVIPGLGQIYNREIKRGAILFSIFLIIVALTTANVNNNASNWFAAIALLLILYSIQDGLACAAVINGENWTVRKSLAFMFYLVFLVSIFVSLAQIAVLPLFCVIHISHDALSPTFRKGDYVLIDSATLKFRAPRLGEIVYYRPTRGFRILYSPPTQPEPVEYFIRPRNMFERVIGFPKDVIEKRSGTMYLNGNELDRTFYPLVQNQVLARFGDFVLEIPKDYYGIILSSVPAEEAGIYRLVRPPHIDLQTPETAQEMIQTGEFQIPIAASFINESWLESCLVSKKDILGRPIAVVHPPERRRVFHQAARLR